MATNIEDNIFGEEQGLLADLEGLTNEEIEQRIRAIDNEIRIMNGDINNYKHEGKKKKETIKNARVCFFL